MMVRGYLSMLYLRSGIAFDLGSRWPTNLFRARNYFAFKLDSESRLRLDPKCTRLRSLQMASNMCDYRVLPFPRHNALEAS